MSAMMEDKVPFKTLLGHALVKDETGRDMHKSWGNAIWFGDAAEKMGGMLCDGYMQVKTQSTICYLDIT